MDQTNQNKRKYENTIENADADCKPMDERISTWAGGHNGHFVCKCR